MGEAGEHERYGCRARLITEYSRPGTGTYVLFFVLLLLLGRASVYSLFIMSQVHLLSPGVTMAV